MHPSQLESLVKQRQADLLRAARRRERPELVSNRGRQRRLPRIREIGFLLIRLGEWLAGPQSPSVVALPSGTQVREPTKTD